MFSELALWSSVCGGLPASCGTAAAPRAWPSNVGCAARDRPFVAVGRRTPSGGALQAVFSELALWCCVCGRLPASWGTAAAPRGRPSSGCCAVHGRAAFWTICSLWWGVLFCPLPKPAVVESFIAVAVGSCLGALPLPFGACARTTTRALPGADTRAADCGRTQASPEADTRASTCSS